ncbi:hypothetical protein PVBG_06256 [Plasmodium vivax Brazil I]|uniref:DNA-directed RNA polymerase subunit n=1 Tax=Plasmodium vivax (strain Brazil I) TaxID=1033975 RepID=A0A0J9SMX3_PLAV1|nr:hypothetical protein PVBG_06256 [Plasmodium vivax Brazil I]
MYNINNFSLGLYCIFCKNKLKININRKYKIGFIFLNIPILHLWYLTGPLKVASLLLNKNIIYLKFLIYYKYFFNNIKYKQYFYYNKLYLKFNINKKKYNIIQYLFSHNILYKKLKNLNLLTELLNNKEILLNKNIHYKKYIYKKINLLNLFIINNLKPNWIFLDLLPILPAGLRPYLYINNSMYIISTINENYRLIILKNNKLKYWLYLRNNIFFIFEIIEKRLLQQLIDYLLINKLILKNNTTFFNFSKYSIIKYNLSGKRVDFSGRSVITVNPNIIYNNIGLPYYISIYLFKPFLINILKYNFKFNVIFKSLLINKNLFSIQKFLNRLLQNQFIIVNRAPTLHRMNLQSFIPLLTEGYSLKFYPLGCSSFNADFDGDQMSVFLPLIKTSKFESNINLNFDKNIISPSNNLNLFKNLQYYKLGINTLLILNYNKVFKKKLLNIFKYNISSKILHELLYLGCEYSFIYNYSLNLNDFSNLIYLLVLYKNKINNIYNNKYYEIKYNYINIFLNNYYYLKVINKIQLILNNTIYLKINPIYSNLFFFFNNKVKIKYSQLQQLIGYKGYISNIKGIIYEKPIINNYINELSIYEYILSCYGSKKGIIDTALKTADSGYLTKRLINITNNFIIKEINCKSPFIFKYKCNMDIYGNIILPFNILQFKILQNNIINKYKGIYFNLKNIYITKYILNNLLNLLSNIYIYLNIKSIYLCNIFNNICNNCLGYKQLYKYNFGQHIGVISSEAIGEPSTQMVLRTFHVNSILKNKYNYNIFKKNNIYRLYSYKFKINQVFKLIFNFKKYINSKFNLVFLINKLLFKYKYLNYNYIIINRFIKYNFIYNSISKNFKYTFSNIFIKYFNNKVKYYSLNMVQLLIKNLYNKWVIYNLYTYYFYYNYIKLYNINKKGIIYNFNVNKKLNIIYFVKSFINFYSYLNVRNNNVILNSNFFKKNKI